jgi:hypothetical protein
MSASFMHKSPGALIDDLGRLCSDISWLQIEGQPADAVIRTSPILNRWSVGVLPATCLIGSVSGHPLLGDRPRVRTTEVFAFDLVAGWARTRSRFYRLGVPAGGFPGGGNA